MKNYWVGLLVLLASCGNSAIEKPSNLIPEDQMVDILYDLSLLDAMKSQNPDKLKNAANVNTYIYSKYKIDSLQFAASNKYYAADLKNYGQLYDRVKERLSSESLKVEAAFDAKKGKKHQKPSEEATSE